MTAGDATVDEPGNTNAAVISPEQVDSLVREHQPMADRLARRYSHGRAPDPDLRQVADIGLFLAATRYDPDTGPFRPFAMVTILGELKKHLRSNGWTVKVPRRIQEATITVATASERLEQRLAKSPTPAQLATETGLSVETILIALQARNSRFVSQEDSVESAAQEAPLAKIDTKMEVDEATSRLSEENRELLALRYDRELTQRQIADRLNISQSAVHRRLTNILTELRTAMAPESSVDP